MKLIENATSEKLRGGFYTPEAIASFILKWAVNGSTGFDILEPSCGDGIFLEQLKENKHKYNSITAIEFDAIEAMKAEKIKLKNKQIINDDFHKYCNNTEKRFDVVVGNPPYIRYQYFDEEQQKEASKVFDRAGLKYSKLTNAWVSFVVGASLLLKENGKIAFVLPAEILQVSYAIQLREFIAIFYNKINIVSFEKLVFPDIQQEVVLLLCEKNNTNTHQIEHLEVRDAEALNSIDVTLLKSPKKKIDYKNNKWTFYFLEQKEIDFLEEVATLKKLKTLGDYAKVEVGITTGSNDFFTVESSIVEHFNLQDFAKPMVGRSVQVNSLIFNNEDWKINTLNKSKAHLLVFPPNGALKNKKGALEYIALGEKNGINKGYKTGIREQWYVVPSIKLSDALFLRRNNVFPKLVENQANAFTTDTMHRVNMKPNTNLKAFVASYYNSLSFAFAEIVGRSYGGGVLELMPSEVEKIVLPYNEDNISLTQFIDERMRNKTSIHKILEYTNLKILKDGYGFSTSEIKLANNIWKKLSDRRINRK
jgi:adenine-specific DNA-methyltransferase